MSDFDLTRLIITVAIVILLLVFLYSTSGGKKKIIDVKFVTRTGVFAAMSVILYIVPGLKFSLPIFPGFLEFHFDEIPALIAAMAYGPLSGFFVILVKTLVKLPMTSTLGVGELADIVYSASFILPAAFLYKKHRSFKGALIALLVGSLIQIVVASFVTTFLILKFYENVMGLPEAVILGMCQAVNHSVNDLTWGYFFIISVPFNAIKDAIVVVVTLLLYKRLHRLIDRIGSRKAA